MDKPEMEEAKEEPGSDEPSKEEPKKSDEVAESAKSKRTKTRRALSVAEDHLPAVVEVLEDLRGQVGDITDDNLDKFIGEAMSAVASVKIEGPVKKEIVQKAVSLMVDKISDEEDKKFLMRTTDYLVSRMIDMVVRAAKGHLPVLAKQAKKGLAKCFTSCSQ